MRDSCGSSGTGETPQALKRRGGSPPAPRKASILERKSTSKFNTAFILKAPTAYVSNEASIIFLKNVVTTVKTPVRIQLDLLKE